MKKKTILIILVIVVIIGLLGGGVYLWQKNKTKLAEQQTQKQLEQKKEQEKSAIQTNINPLFTVKKIDFISIESFDNNDPYYNIIIQNANNRLGKVIDTGGYEKTGEDIKEGSIIGYSITNDGYIFVTYGAWGFSRLAKIDLQSGKLVAEYYYFARSDSSPGGPTEALCYYGGDKNKILFKNEYSRGGQSYIYYYEWDLSKKSISGSDLIELPIKDDSELTNYCKAGEIKTTTQQPSFDQSQFLPKGAVLNKSIDIDFKNDGIFEKVLAYTVPNSTEFGDKYYVKVYEYDGSKWDLIKDDQGTQNLINIIFDKLQKIVWNGVDNQEYLAISKNMAGNDPSWSTYLYFYDKEKKTYSEAYPDTIGNEAIKSLVDWAKTKESQITGFNMILRGIGFEKNDEGFVFGNYTFKAYFSYTGNGKFVFLKKEMRELLDSYGNKIK